MCNFIWSEKQTLEAAARQLDLDLDITDAILGDKNPTDQIIAALPSGFQSLRWSLIPHWSKEIPGVLMTQARIETLHEKPAFRSLLAANRCIIPVTGFYEWFIRHKYGITRKDGQPMFLAALWDEWNGEKSATIITTEPTDFVRRYQDRMPLILDPSELQTWLRADFEPAKQVLHPRETDLIATSVTGQQSLF